MKIRTDYWIDDEMETYEYEYPDEKTLLAIFEPEKIINRELNKNIRIGGRILAKETIPLFKKIDKLEDPVAREYWKAVYLQEAGWYNAIKRNLKRLRRLKSLLNPSKSFTKWQDKKVAAKQKPILEIFEPQKLMRTAKGQKCLCPLHADTDPSFHYYAEDNTWHCFGENIGGDSIELARRLYKLDMAGAINYLVGAQ